MAEEIRTPLIQTESQRDSFLGQCPVYQTRELSISFPDPPEGGRLNFRAIDSSGIPYKGRVEIPLWAKTQEDYVNVASNILAKMSHEELNSFRTTLNN